MNLTKVEQNSPYGYLEHFISAISQVVELQLSSLQIEESIRFTEGCTVIA